MTSEATTPAAARAPAGRGHLHPPLAPGRAELWRRFGEWDERYFPNVVGLEVEDLRSDYARMRLPYRPELRQPAGVVHGGAIATLIDTVVVPAVGTAYDQVPVMLTIDMQVRYLGAARQADLVAEGWVVRRGRTVVFCQAEVVTQPGGQVVAEGWLTYRVVPPNGG
jgi:uncharacterized protein (TIGR00369 family)